MDFPPDYHWLLNRWQSSWVLSRAGMLGMLEMWERTFQATCGTSDQVWSKDV